MRLVLDVSGAAVHQERIAQLAALAVKAEGEVPCPGSVPGQVHMCRTCSTGTLVKVAILTLSDPGEISLA